MPETSWNPESSPAESTVLEMPSDTKQKLFDSGLLFKIATGSTGVLAVRVVPNAAPAGSYLVFLFGAKEAAEQATKTIGELLEIYPAKMSPKHLTQWKGEALLKRLAPDSLLEAFDKPTKEGVLYQRGGFFNSKKAAHYSLHPGLLVWRPKAGAKVAGCVPLELCRDPECKGDVLYLPLAVGKTSCGQLSLYADDSKELTDWQTALSGAIAAQAEAANACRAPVFNGLSKPWKRLHSCLALAAAPFHTQIMAPGLKKQQEEEEAKAKEKEQNTSPRGSEKKINAANAGTTSLKERMKMFENNKKDSSPQVSEEERKAKAAEEKKKRSESKKAMQAKAAAIQLHMPGGPPPSRKSPEKSPATDATSETPESASRNSAGATPMRNSAGATPLRNSAGNNTMGNSDMTPPRESETPAILRAENKDPNLSPGEMRHIKKTVSPRKTKRLKTTNTFTAHRSAPSAQVSSLATSTITIHTPPSAQGNSSVSPRNSQPFATTPATPAAHARRDSLTSPSPSRSQQEPINVHMPHPLPHPLEHPFLPSLSALTISESCLFRPDDVVLPPEDGDQEKWQPPSVLEALQYNSHASALAPLLWPMREPSLESRKVWWALSQCATSKSRDLLAALESDESSPASRSLMELSEELCAASKKDQADSVTYPPRLSEFLALLDMGWLVDEYGESICLFKMDAGGRIRNLGLHCLFTRTRAIAARKIQAEWKASLEKKKQGKIEAATTVQKTWRMYVQKQRFKRLLHRYSWDMLDKLEESELAAEHAAYEAMKERMEKLKPSTKARAHRESSVLALQRYLDAQKQAKPVSLSSKKQIPHRASAVPLNFQPRNSVPVARLIPHEGELDQNMFDKLLSMFRKGLTLDEESVMELLHRVDVILEEEPNVVELELKEGNRLTVVGDIHGQLEDLLTIFSLNGQPSPRNPYLFNGDFVDRGQNSVECIIILFFLKVLFPSAVHLNRGNHEARDINGRDGFERECVEKYKPYVFNVFSSTFAALPLAHIIHGQDNRKVWVVHAGLWASDETTIEDIRQLDRHVEIPERNGVMEQMLWSDPVPEPGRSPSPRGGGVLFGPDVVASFLEREGVEFIIRSHEMVMEGYEENYDGKVITVFSASNYTGVCGNQGAFIILQRDLSRKYQSYMSLGQQQTKKTLISELQISVVGRIVERIASLRFELFLHWQQVDANNTLEEKKQAEQAGQDTSAMPEHTGLVARSQWSKGLQQVLKLQGLPFLFYQRDLQVPMLGMDGTAYGSIDYTAWLQCYQLKTQVKTTTGKNAAADFANVDFDINKTYDVKSVEDATAEAGKDNSTIYQILFKYRHQLQSLFRWFDLDGNGTISASEFYEGVSSLQVPGLKFSKEHAAQVLAELAGEEPGKENTEKEVDYTAFFERFQLMDRSLSSTRREMTRHHRARRRWSRVKNTMHALYVMGALGFGLGAVAAASYSSQSEAVKEAS